MKKFLFLIPCAAVGLLALTSVFTKSVSAQETQDETVTLRICNWEEYIDLGDWDEDEVIDLESGDIFGEQSLIEDFEVWYYETYGINVEVVYSTFGTNEDLYNMLTLGDVYDLICPSEYMVMKLMTEDALVPLSDAFFDTSDEYNYYINGVSPYLQDILDSQEIDGETWSKYMAGYMWGITGIVYNPEVISEDEASTWTILNDSKYQRRITVKDNVRDSYFAAVGAIKSELLTSEEFINDPDYLQNLEDEMNDTSAETIALAQAYLQSVKDNAYSFETDSGKADMITGKVVANYQWSGDAVYTLDLAEEDGYILNFAVPKEATNIYFDGWVMLKSGIGDDEAKQHAAEAFINFCSRPDNAIRNMYYIGYTSFIAAPEDGRIYEYAEWCYGAEEDETETTEYSLAYFFTGDTDSTANDDEYTLTVPLEQIGRQLTAQYPTLDSISRAAIMICFDSETNEAINDMWINVRCFNIHNVPTGLWIALGSVIAVLAAFMILKRRAKMRY